jgi:antitoxin component YwqK of YwqJK toxin-antitoxin module
MENFKNGNFGWVIIVIMALFQSCEKREQVVRTLPDPIGKYDFMETHFNALVENGKYLRDGECQGYVGGKLVMIANYKKDVLDGAFKRFYRNGNPESRFYFENGVIVGEFLSYRENGQKVESGTYNNGKKTGDWFLFNEAGSVAAKFVYENGSNVSIIGKWDMNNGKIYNFLPNGKLQIIDGNDTYDGEFEIDSELLSVYSKGKPPYDYKIISFESGSLIIKGVMLEVNDFQSTLDDNTYVGKKLNL